jgi:hypothetical protein
MDERDTVERDDETGGDEPDRTTGEILGVARVPGVPAAEGLDREIGTDLSDSEAETESATNRGESHVGTRDVTEGTTGGTGPDTGGAGVLRRGSGATGTDIGK